MTDTHPTNGAWRPLDALVLTDADPATSCPRGFTGFTVRLSTVQKRPDPWERFYDRLVDLDAPLRIDLDDRGPARRRKDFAAALDAGPDLVSFSCGESPWSNESFRSIDEEAAAEEIALVLSGSPALLRDHGALEVARLVDWFHESQSVTALRMAAFDEDLAEGLGRLEGAGLFSPGFEFASAFRHGAGAFDGLFGLLGPAAAVEALQMLQEDLPGALQLERKLQRFTEGAFERTTRGWDPARRQRALSDTFAYFEESGEGRPPSIVAEDWSALLSAVHRLELFPA